MCCCSCDCVQIDAYELSDITLNVDTYKVRNKPRNYVVYSRLGDYPMDTTYGVYSYVRDSLQTMRDKLNETLKELDRLHTKKGD